MKVGVYIDGFNLYYGARQSCGKGTAGWRWLDVRSLVASRLPSQWADAEVSRVVYCTARVAASTIRAPPRTKIGISAHLRLAELSTTSSPETSSPGYATPFWSQQAKGQAVIVLFRWPVMVKDAARADVPNATPSSPISAERRAPTSTSPLTSCTTFSRQRRQRRCRLQRSDSKLPIAVARDQCLLASSRRAASVLRATFRSHQMTASDRTGRPISAPRTKAVDCRPGRPSAQTQSHGDS